MSALKCPAVDEVSDVVLKRNLKTVSKKLPAELSIHSISTPKKNGDSTPDSSTASIPPHRSQSSGKLRNLADKGRHFSLALAFLKDYSYEGIHLILFKFKASPPKATNDSCKTLIRLLTRELALKSTRAPPLRAFPKPPITMASNPTEGMPSKVECRNRHHKYLSSRSSKIRHKYQ